MTDKDVYMNSEATVTDEEVQTDGTSACCQNRRVCLYRLRGRRRKKGVGRGEDRRKIMFLRTCNVRSIK